MPGQFSSAKVAIYKYVGLHYEDLSLLMVKSKFVIADVNYTNYNYIDDNYNYNYV